MTFYLQAFLTFFKIGLFTIGGGYAMIPLIQSEIVDKKKWIDSNEFVDLMAISQSIPGIFAVNISIFIGYKLRKLKGAVAMASGTILPSFLIISGIALFFQQFKDNETVQRIFKGIRPGVVALIAAPAFQLAKSVRITRSNSWIPVMSALAIWRLGLSPVYVIILAGVGGFLYGKYKRKKTAA